MDNLAAGRDVILEIDVNGCEQVKKSLPQALSIFVLPPSEEELLRRLRQRGREDEARIQRRFAEAKREMAQARGNHAYDHFIVNVELDQAVEQAYRIVRQARAGVPT
jgi:guanylate kinase